VASGFQGKARSIKLKCHLGQNDEPADRSGDSRRQRAANGNSQRGPNDRRTAEVTTKRTERLQTILATMPIRSLV
jgi:hypothetical protein